MIMAMHLIVYVVEKAGYDPIQKCKMTIEGDFVGAKCLVRRPLGYALNTTDIDLENTIERFFEHNMTLTELRSMQQACHEISESVEAEAVSAFERIKTLERVFENRLNKIRERSGTAALSRATTRLSTDDQPESF